MSRQLSLCFFIPSTSRSIVSWSVTDDLSQPNQNQNNAEDDDDANSPAADTTQAGTQTISNIVIVSKVYLTKWKTAMILKKNLIMDVHTPTVANTEQSMLSVKVHTKPQSDLATVPTKSPTQPKINFPS